MGNTEVAKFYGKKKIPPHLAILILQELEAFQISPQKILNGSGLRAEDLLHKGQDLSLQQMMCIIENALELSPVEGLGLYIGSRETISTNGVLGFALMSCANEKEVLDIGIKFQEVLPSTLLISAEQDNNRLRFQLDGIVPKEQALVFCVEENISAMCTIYSQVTQDSISPLEIHLSYPKPNYAHLYEEFFNCPISYNQPHNAFWTRLPTEKPLQYTNSTTAKATMDLVENIADQYTLEDDLILQIRKILLRNPGKYPSMEYVSAELNMSSRTLRRKLKELGFSFSAIVDEIRMNLAIDYLHHSRLTTAELAIFMGYSEESSFRRAFKGWTGHNPSYYRKQ